MILVGQVRAARAFLRWRPQDLADASGVGVATIRCMEIFDGVPAEQIRSLPTIQSALDATGVEFIGPPDDMPRVRLKIFVVTAKKIQAIGSK